MSYVCVCNAVRDIEVQSAIDAGANTISAVHEKCGAGKQCCMCHDIIKSLIKKKRDKDKVAK